jgi:small basic protein (TIGR04137 family)
MSLHKSLVIRDRLARRRNVLTRAERVAALAKLGLLDESKSVFGLPKLKVRKVKRRVKEKKKIEAAAVAAAAASAEGAAAPATAAPEKEKPEKGKAREKK